MKKFLKPSVILPLVLLAAVIIIAFSLVGPSAFHLSGLPDADYSASMVNPYTGNTQVPVCVYDDSVYYVSREWNSPVVRRATENGNRIVCRMGDTYKEYVLGVVDHDTLILDRRGGVDAAGEYLPSTLVLYSVKDKTDRDIGQVEFVAYKDGIVYCCSETETDELHVYDCVLYGYSVLNGSFTELHRFTGSIVSQNAEAIVYKEERVHYYSLTDKAVWTFFEEIPWTKPKYPMLTADINFYPFSHYIVGVSGTTIEVYDMDTGELTMLLPNNGTRLIYASITEETLYFSNWDVDAAFWPLKDEANGFYKYTFADGNLEKISDGKYYNIFVPGDGSAIVRTMMGKIKKIRLPG